MNWYDSLTALVDLRSFSSIWYWIALAVLWSTASHWVLGIPFDMVTRAARNGGQAEDDLEDVTRVMTNRLLAISRISGVWALGLACFLLTSLGLLGFWFGIQIAQAVFLMAFPMAIVGLLSLNTARLIQERGARGPDLRKLLWQHRVWVQVIGMIAIFITAMWGMYQNMRSGIHDHFGPYGAITIEQDYHAQDHGWRRP